MSRTVESPRPKDENFLSTIAEAKSVLDKFQFPYVFVGGALSAQIGTDTTLGEIDLDNKTFSLVRSEPVSARREKDRSKRDIDILAFCKDPETFDEASKALKQAVPDISVSMEPVRYSNWPQRSRLTQFNLGNDIDDEGRAYFVFDDMRQEVPRESLDVWTLRTEDGQEIPVFNPAAHAMRYLVRASSGLKPKDEGEKLNNLMRVAGEFTERVAEIDPEKDENYFNGLYEPWLDFMEDIWLLPVRPLSRVSYSAAKVQIVKAYWSTIGEKLAHGQGGKLGELISKLGDRFAG